MSQPLPDSPLTSDDQVRVEALRAELALARQQLDRATVEYEGLLADHDTIQEDRDAAGQLVAQAQADVTRTEAALARAESGSYGRCVRCGAPIPPERLAALPSAVTCVSCS